MSTFVQANATASVKAVAHRTVATIDKFGPVSIQIRAHNGYRDEQRYAHPCTTPTECMGIIARACDAGERKGFRVGGVIMNDTEVPTEPKALLSLAKKQVRAGMTLWVSRFGSIVIGSKDYYPGTRERKQQAAKPAGGVDLSDIADLLD